MAILDHAFRIQFSLNATDLPANTAHELIAPADGYIQGIDAIVQAAVTTGGTLTVKNYRSDLAAGVGTPVLGLTATIANAATKGAKPTANVAATAGSDTRKVTAGTRIEIVPTGFATAGALNGILTFVSMDRGAAKLP